MNLAGAECQLMKQKCSLAACWCQHGTLARYQLYIVDKKVVFVRLDCFYFELLTIQCLGSFHVDVQSFMCILR